MDAVVPGVPNMMCQRCGEHTATHRVWGELLTLLVCPKCAAVAMKPPFSALLWVDLLEEPMKIGLNEAPFESMRTPDEIAQDQDREAHLGGYCKGVPYCWFCNDEEIKCTHCGSPLDRPIFIDGKPYGKVCADIVKAKACAEAFRPLAELKKCLPSK